MTGERFIPFRRTSIVAMCTDDAPAAERKSFQAFAELLTSLIHHEFRTRLEALKDTYHPFNPDTETRTVGEPTPAERQEALAANHEMRAQLQKLSPDAVSAIDRLTISN